MARSNSNKLGHFSPRTLQIVGLLHRGDLTLAQIRDMLPWATRNMVAGARDRYRAGVYDSVLHKLKTSMATGEPSQAMVRLAEFDPVVHRAMLQKRGLPPQD